MPPTKLLPPRFEHPLPDVEASRAPTDPLRRVTAGLAHNVNNGLVGVISFLELALREAEPDSPLQHRLTDGLHCAQRVAQRVRRMVAFAYRPEVGKASSACLRAAAEQTAHDAAADRPDLSVILQTPDAPCLVPANETLLQLVLEQVVSNALEAMPDGGTLLIRAWDEGHRRCISVADSGPGLSAEVRGRLFEPFFTTKSFGHLGLGLALCRDVTAAQGGALHVASTESLGTTVTLSFPPPEGSIPAPTFPPNPPASGDGSVN